QGTAGLRRGSGAYGVLKHRPPLDPSWAQDLASWAPSGSASGALPGGLRRRSRRAATQPADPTAMTADAAHHPAVDRISCLVPCSSGSSDGARVAAAISTTAPTHPASMTPTTAA